MKPSFLFFVLTLWSETYSDSLETSWGHLLWTSNTIITVLLSISTFLSLKTRLLVDHTHTHSHTHTQTHTHAHHGIVLSLSWVSVLSIRVAATIVGDLKDRTELSATNQAREVGSDVVFTTSKHSLKIENFREHHFLKNFLN